MKRGTLTVLTLTLSMLGLLGCAGRNGGPRHSQQARYPLGRASSLAGDGTWVTGFFTKISDMRVFVHSPIPARVDANSVILTGNVVKLLHKFTRKGEAGQRDMLFGPNPDQKTAAIGWMQASGSYYVAHSFLLDDGDYPVNETTRVRAGGIGTRFVIQVTETVHRVIFLKGSKVTVTSKIIDPDEPGGTRVMNAPDHLGHYVEVGPDGKISEPAPVSGDEDVQAFFEYVNELAAEAGM